MVKGLDRIYLIKVTTLSFLVASFSVIIGCTDTQKIKTTEPLISKPEFYQPLMQASAIPEKRVSFPEYRLNIGDIIEIIYHVKHIVEHEYRFHTEDIITIKFPYQPQYDQTVTITPDGKIRLLLIGEVDCFKWVEKDGRRIRVGKTIKELADELREKYSKFIKDPDLTVSFKAANVKIEELKRAITTSPRGQSRLMPVKPDGNITLPYIKDIRAYGKTVEELHADINRAYEEIGLPEIEVTVQLLEPAKQKIFVMGEVRNPGLINAPGRITITQALAMAGGLTPRAADDRILIVRRKHLPLPEAVIVNLKRILDTKAFAKTLADGKDGASSLMASRLWQSDFWLDDYDLVYVPRSDLAETNDWIEQVFTRGIYGVLPFTSSVGIGFSYELHDASSSNP